MPCFEFEGLRPVVHPGAFVHPSAVLIGDVVIEAGCLVGPCASLRGDIGRIVLGAGSNVQDSCVLHCFPGRGVTVEPGGHVGHASVLHGCTVRRGALIGINAVVMDDAEIGEDAIVAVLAFVRAGTVVPPRSLVAGIPATVIRELRPDEIEWKREGTRVYQHLARRYLETAREVPSLPEVEPGRPSLPPIDYAPKHESPGAG